jgi:hypothetical protein
MLHLLLRSTNAACDSLLPGTLVVIPSLSQIYHLTAAVLVQRRLCLLV